MNGAVLLLIASAAFLAGYFIYAKLIERKLGVDPSCMISHVISVCPAK